MEVAKSGECESAVAGIADPSSLSPSPYDGHPQLYPASEQVPEAQESDDSEASDKNEREAEAESKPAQAVYNAIFF